jgi:hypothetical protein
VRAAIFALQLLVCIPYAYALAKLRFPGRDTLFSAVLVRPAAVASCSRHSAFVLLNVFELLDTWPNRDCPHSLRHPKFGHPVGKSRRTDFRDRDPRRDCRGAPARGSRRLPKREGPSRSWQSLCRISKSTGFWSLSFRLGLQMNTAALAPIDVAR